MGIKKQPGYVPQPGERIGQAVGQLAGEGALIEATGAGGALKAIGQAAARPAAAVAGQTAGRYAGAGAQGGAIGGIFSVLNQMADRGEVDPADVASAAAIGVPIGIGFQAGADGATMLVRSNASAAVQRVAAAAAKRVQGEVNQVLYNVKRGLGIPQELGLVPYDAKAALAAAQQRFQATRPGTPEYRL